jgi:hypothetical protein
MLPDRKKFYTIGELVLCNCTERAEGDKMGGGGREEKIGCGQKQLLMLQVSWEIDDRGWVRLALWDGAILPPMMSPGSSLTKFWRALQPLIPFKGSGEYSCEDSRHPPVIHFILLLHQSFAR